VRKLAAAEGHICKTEKHMGFLAKRQSKAGLTGIDLGRI
jgi:hypothetical protein